MEERKIGATDLGIAVDNKENILYLYGDSFSGNDVNIGIWNSNFIAKSSSRELPTRWSYRLQTWGTIFVRPSSELIRQ